MFGVHLRPRTEFWASTSLPKSAYVIAAALSPLRSTNALLRTFANLCNVVLERTLRRLLKKLPEGYSASIQKTGKVALVCTDSQMEKLETHSKLRIYVVRQKKMAT